MKNLLAIAGLALFLISCKEEIRTGNSSKINQSLASISSRSDVKPIEQENEITNEDQPVEIDEEVPIDIPIEIEPIEEEVIDFPNFEAEFPGGQQSLSKYFAKNVRYPEIAKKMAIQGKVFVQFKVQKDGSISHVKVVKGVHPALDKEAVRTVKKMPKWKPAEMQGRYTATTYTLPINFRLL